MSDLISRQAAIYALEKALYEYADETEQKFQASDELNIDDWFIHRIHVQRMNDVDIQTIVNLPSVQPEHGRWNNHEVACLIADLFGDPCACNFNGIDEWLPTYCDFSSTCCPHPDGVACWEQYLKHLDKRHDEVSE